MCNKSSGSFEIKFQKEKDFIAFGYKYASCFGNVGTKAVFSRPVAQGERGYTIDFEANCGCETLIGEFNKAYKKTFGDGSGILLQLPAQELIFADGSTPGMDPPSAYDITLTACRPSHRTLYKRTTALPHLSQLAAAAPATSVNATAIDSQMNYALPDVPVALTNAIANTTLYAQAASRYILKQQGVDITKSDYLNSKQWYDEVIAQMIDLGFVANYAAHGELNRSTHSGEIKLKDLVTEIVSSFIAGPELTAFENLAELLTKNPDNTGVANFLDFWWSAASSHTNNVSVAWGPVLVAQNSPSVTCVYMNIDVAFSDWRSLFVSFHSENVNITSSAVTLNLDMDVYDGQGVGKRIITALGDNIKAHIDTQPLSFS